MKRIIAYITLLSLTVSACIVQAMDIFQATNNEDVAMVAQLLTGKGIGVNSANEYGYTPLHVAVDKVNIEIVRLLLRHPDIEVNTIDNTGNTPLHLAASHGYIEIVRLLLGHPDIAVNSTNNLGDTPLHFAAEEDHGEIVRLLLENGSDVYLTNDIDESPLNIAKPKAQKIIEDFIHQRLHGHKDGYGTNS
jgi:ankyrin repeat protein